MNEKITEGEFSLLMDKADVEKRPCIAIFKDADGNWRGGIKHKYEVAVFVRDIGPETCLQLLLTHDGK